MMNALLVLLGLGVLALPIAVVVLLVGQSRLKERVAALEAGLAPALKRPVADDIPAEFRDDPLPEAPLPLPEVALSPMAPPQSTPPGPWEVAGATVEPRPDGPVVFTADRMAALSRWLRENWVYAVSALSLALAGVFFVQYGIDNGLLPPGLRVLAGLAFGAALIGGG